MRISPDARGSIRELDQLRESIAVGAVFDGVASMAGADHRIWALRDATNTVLVLVAGNEKFQTPDPLLAAMFGIVATSMRHQVAQAGPDYLAESRAASSERARTIAELTELHEATLASILGTLRSNDLDARQSRFTAGETASAALIALHSANAADRELSEEAVTTAFARLQGGLRPPLRGPGRGSRLRRPTGRWKTAARCRRKGASPPRISSRGRSGYRRSPR